MHQSVLLKEGVDGLSLKKGDVVVDGTLGAGGHTEEILNRFGKDIKVIAFDLDHDAIERSKARLGEENSNVTFVENNFRNIDTELSKLNIEKVNGIILDLGFSSDQLELSERGFSFQKDEPLIMTLRTKPTEDEFTAYDIVNNWAEEDIANVLYGYGEERFARRIAREIVEARETSPIKTTFDLVKIVENAVPAFYRLSRINPATKTFQALRIATNGELEALKEVLEKGFKLLEIGGHFSIITFHSLEDRIVKNFFKNLDKENLGEMSFKKPILPSEEELLKNKRARSAKLRIIKKIS